MYAPLTTSTSAGSVLADLAADAWFQAQHDVTASAPAPARHRGMLPSVSRPARFPAAAAAERHSRAVAAASWL